MHAPLSRVYLCVSYGFLVKNAAKILLPDFTPVVERVYRSPLPRPLLYTVDTDSFCYHLKRILRSVGSHSELQLRYCYKLYYD